MSARSRSVVAAVIGLSLTSCTGPKPITASHTKAKRGDFIVTARATGELRAVRSEDLVVPRSRGRTQIASLVADGKAVTTGELLLEFDPSELQKDLRDRQADLNTKQKELEKSQLAARSEIERLEVELARARVDLDKVRILAASDPAITESNDIRKAEADVRALTIAVDERTRAIALATTRQDRQSTSLVAYIQWAENAVRLAEEQLAAFALKAPVDGTALVNDHWSGGQRRKFQVGDNAWEGQAVVSIPDLREMEAMLYVEEADIARVSVRQPVTLTIDAAPEREFTGKVKSIPPLAERLSWSNPAKVFRVVATVENPDPKLMRPGMRLQAMVELERHADVVTVPLEIVSERDGHMYVDLASGERLEVALGARNASHVIVLSGVAEGAELSAARGGRT